MSKEYDHFWKFHNKDNMDVHAVRLIEQQAEQIAELEAENKKLRRPLEAANFKVDGMLAIGNELTKQAERIEILEAELEQHRWIPVSESLPEKTGYYLIFCVSEGYNEHRWWQFWYQDGWYEYNKIDDCIDDTERTVTHWKPIILEQALKG